MLADPLTKPMSASRLDNAIETNFLDFRQTDDMKAEKLRKNASSKARKELKKQQEEEAS